MKLLLGVVLALLAAVSAALILMRDPGYVLVAYGPWSLETSLALFTVLVTAGFAALYVGLRFVINLWRLPGRARTWRKRRLARRAREALTRGLIALAEGRWEEAEKRLIRHARHSETPLLYYLGAARAAQQRGAHERRDHYLHLAHESMPAADVAVGLTQAELQIAHRQLEQALATLTHLRTVAPRHGYVLKMLMKLYRQLKDWEHLRELLPELRRRKVVTRDEADALEKEIYGSLLDRAATAGDAARLQRVWAEIPRQHRADEGLLIAYATRLMAAGAGAEAEPQIRGALNRRWSDRLVYLYGLVEGADAERQLAAVEGWLKDHGKDPLLLLTAGRLCIRNRLWGKARIYLESSIGAGPRPETYRELGLLLEKMGERGSAADCYRKGLQLAAGQADGPAAARPDRDEAARAAASALAPRLSGGSG